MKRNRNPETRLYRSFADDFVESRNQSFRLPENYAWIHEKLPYRIFSKCLYLLAVLFAFPYCRFGLHMKIEDRSAPGRRTAPGCFLYGNHTQPVGDAFIPVRIFAPRHCYVGVSPANLGIPILGPLLPMLGALPMPRSISGMKQFKEAVRVRTAGRGCVAFYPEAHVWPWYTGIRPFPAAPFGFPVECRVPCFCMTTTYQKRKRGRKPGITVYLDGPFYPDGSLSRKRQKEKLRDEIYGCMVRRSQNSTYQYINYEKAEF